jgi:uncharacterized protein YbaP (TraB family)
LAGLLAVGFLGISWVGSASVASQTAQTRIAPTEKPFLWRIDGAVPSYLYGTVHVPDARVLELPEVVRRAFDASDVFYAEIPLDPGTQISILGRIMLPEGKTLRTVAGDAVFNRLVRAVGRALGSDAPPGMAEAMGAMFTSMKPWAAMSQVELLEFLPDLASGRQPLDAMLYEMAGNAKKELAALETVEEQLAVFDSFSDEEQVRLLVASLDDMEKPRPAGVSATKEVVDLYLAGDLDRLAVEANKRFAENDPLHKKFMTRLVDDRNILMANRIAEFCRKKPTQSHFFAVGAMHYAGATGIITQLGNKGFKVTRLGPNDAKSIVRKPAA